MIRDCSEPEVFAEEASWQVKRRREIDRNPKSMKLYRSIYEWHGLRTVACSWKEALPTLRAQWQEASDRACKADTFIVLPYPPDAPPQDSNTGG